MSTPHRRPWRAAVLWMIACSLLFFIVYGGCNWITAQRYDVGTWYYEWELRISFVPMMIVPYWSVALFFVGSFFVCTGRRELNTLTGRIAMAIVVAGGCFLLFPLKIVFPRPQVAGVLGAMFDLLRAMDQPYNLFPSLHIALRTILVATYARHCAGITRGALHVWFSLIGFSTILIYQHQVVDVAGGFVLAGLCFYVFSDSPARLPVMPNRRVGTYYGAGGVVAVFAAWSLWPWGALFLWPALALGLVAGGYFGWGPAIFRKADGRIPLSARIVLGPVLCGQALSLVYYRRQCRPRDAVSDRVWIGRKLTDKEAAAAVKEGVTAVLDLTGEFSEARPFLATNYRNVPIFDLTAPTAGQLAEAADFIGQHDGDGIVYVHCKIGYSRSAAVVAAYLMKTGQARGVDEAIELVRAARPTVVVRPEARAALCDFEPRP